MKSKHITTFILLCLLTMLTSCASAYAGWLGSNNTSELAEQKQKLSVVENQLTLQRKNMSYWQIATGSLAIAAILLFGIGTALGSHTRNRHATTPGL